MTYILNMRNTYVLTISLFGNPWQNHNKQMNIWEKSQITQLIFTLVEYNKIYPNTNSWKTLKEENLQQVDFDNLYFWNTLNKTHQGIFMWNRNNRLHTINKKHVYKGRKETTHERISEKKTYISNIEEKNKYNVCL